MPKKTIFAIMLIALLIVTACASPMPQTLSGKSDSAERRAVATVMVEREVAVERMAAAPESGTSSLAQDYADEEGPAGGRMIIRTGDLLLLVADTERAVQEIQDLTAALDGYVVNSNAWRSGDRVRANMTIRVPASSFDAAMDQIKDLANVVNRDTVSGQDVTEEYADLAAQLRNLEATEAELLELLAQVRERTGKAEDILAVYRELTNIRSQIERIKGRTQYLERMTAMATINIELEPDIVDGPVSTEKWRPNATISSALNRLVDSLQWLADAAIWFVFYLAPVLILLLLPLALLVFLINLWRKRKQRD